MEDGAAQETYFQVFASADNLTPELVVEAAGVAARQTTSSSTLEAILDMLGPLHANDEAVTLALIEGSRTVTESDDLYDLDEGHSASQPRLTRIN